MKAIVHRMLAATALSVAVPLAAHAAELYSPALPATGNQFLECVIVNVSAASQTVTTEALNSNGVAIGGPYTQTLTAGQMGGFSIAAFNGGTYCKFTVSGAVAHYRADINVLDTKPDGTTYIVVALPAH
jgi:hypothetical protein